jgi:hypothetical protein
VAAHPSGTIMHQSGDLRAQMRQRTEHGYVCSTTKSMTRAGTGAPECGWQKQCELVILWLKVVKGANLLPNEEESNVVDLVHCHVTLLHLIHKVVPEIGHQCCNVACQNKNE